jgi:excisionase family DNA binding protein
LARLPKAATYLFNFPGKKRKSLTNRRMLVILDLPTREFFLGGFFLPPQPKPKGGFSNMETERTGDGVRGLLNVKEAAAFLGIGVQTVYNRVSQRRIDHVKIGRRVLFRLSDLEKLIEAGSVGAESYDHN